MGLGDNLMAAGMARGAKERGKRVAFGDGKKIRWDQNSEIIFRFNPNVAKPGDERARDLKWVRFFKGERQYNRQDGDARWIWSETFKAKPGEIYLTDHELAYGKLWGEGFILIEPNVPVQKSCAPNKEWGFDRFEAVAREFVSAGYKVVQFGYPRAKHRLQNATYISTPTFRHALAVLATARLAILPEGGLHHGAAARVVNAHKGNVVREFVPAVVLFGGFIPPSVTGYDVHVNLTGGAQACGSLRACEHCRSAMEAISVTDVLKAADGLLANG